MLPKELQKIHSMQLIHRIPQMHFYRKHLHRTNSFWGKRLWLFDPMVAHAKLNIPTLIHAFSLQTGADVLIIPTPVSDCWWRWSFYVGIKSVSGAMIEELLDGKDGEGHLSAVVSRAYQPMETRSSARMDRERKRQRKMSVWNASLCMRPVVPLGLDGEAV